MNVGEATVLNEGTGAVVPLVFCYYCMNLE